jgi:hypothetical protein
LGANRVGTGANKGLDFEILFEGLKEDLDLPAILIDGGNGSSGKVQMISRECTSPEKTDTKNAWIC